MHILIVVDTLLTGGAEWFLLRKWAYLRSKGWQVELVVSRPDLVDNRFSQSFPDLRFLSARIWMVRMAVFGDRILRRISGRMALLDWLTSLKIRSAIRHFDPELIHSHLFQADYKAFLANLRTRAPHLITVHGDYIESIKRKQSGLFAQMKRVLREVDRIIVISEEQRRMLGEFCPETRQKTQKIYNGYPVSAVPASPPQNSFIFGLIARPIPEKGWESAIHAFLLADIPGATLRLYGEGDFLHRLAAKYDDPRIEFCGFASRPLDAVSGFSAGLFPSYYLSESLPTTIIEYLIVGKPVITTPVGECAQMIETPTGTAGIVIGLVDGLPDIEALAKAMKQLAADRPLYDACSVHAHEAAARFSFEHCMNQYISEYLSLKISRTCAESQG
jgi:glycosyltransferase involved in cell wall biosynthesis